MHHAQAQYSPRQLLESARRAEVDGNVDLAVHVSRYVLEHFAGTPESSEAYASLVRLGQASHDIAYAGNGHGTAVRAVNGHANGQVNGHTNGYATTGYGAHARSVNGTSNGYANGHAHQYASATQVVRAQVPAPLPAPAAQGNGHAAHMQIPVQTIAANFAPAAPYRGGAEASPPAVIHHAPEATRQYRGGRFVARFTFTAGWIMILSGLLSPVPALMGLLGASPNLMGAALVAGALVAGGLLALLGGQTALAVFDQADSMRELVELERTRWDA